MARALFLGLPLHGHTNPTLPLVRELVDRGEEITYYSADAFAGRIEQAGARYRPYRNAFLAGIKDLPERMDQLSWLLMRTTAEVLDAELSDFRAERPDYLICDAAAPWGRCVAELLGVPAVTSVATFAINRHVLAFGVCAACGPGACGSCSPSFATWAGGRPQADDPPRARHRRAGADGPAVRPLGPDHRLHLAGVPAPRRDLRRAVPVRRPVRRPEGRGSAIPLGGTAPPGRGVRLARYALQHRGGVLPGLFRGAGGRGLPGRPLDRLRRGEGGHRSAASQLHRAALRPAARRPAAGRGVRDPRRHEQREREPLLRGARGGGPPDGRAGDRRPTRRTARRGLFLPKAAVTAEALRAAVRRVLSDEPIVARPRRWARPSAPRRRRPAADAILAFTRGSRPPRDQTASSPLLQP